MFIRHFLDSPEQLFRSRPEDRELRSNGLLILNYRSPSTPVHYKLVISGLNIKAGKRLFGTLYLYQEAEGGLYNGLPVGFQPD